MDLEQLGSGGSNPCGDSVKKMSTHFLSRINGWTWFNWGLGAQIHVETVSRKGIFIFLAQAKEMSLIFLVLLTDGFGAIGVLGPKSMWRQC